MPHYSRKLAKLPEAQALTGTLPVILQEQAYAISISYGVLNRKRAFSTCVLDSCSLQAVTGASDRAGLEYDKMFLCSAAIRLE
eukprot:1139848-Pelagomonas_calceolata.AAC.7